MDAMIGGMRIVREIATGRHALKVYDRAGKLVYAKSGHPAKEHNLRLGLMFIHLAQGGTIRGWRGSEVTKGYRPFPRTWSDPRGRWETVIGTRIPRASRRKAAR